MARYRKKPAITEATQWFRNGDHPQDNSKDVETAGGGKVLSEGEVVKFFRRLNIPGNRFCQECGNAMQKHGLLDGLSGEEIICPGDYIVTDRRGKHYKMIAGDFEAQYEPYGENVPHPTPRRERQVYDPSTGEKNDSQTGDPHKE